ncbi:MAG: hypothetical protein LBD79_04045 [Treponema sp.]|nr:hypothetical protein [Treponema sp.]
MRKISEIRPDTSLLSVVACLESGKTVKPVSKPQEALTLLLKFYLFVSDDFITRVASAMGVSVEKLTTMLDKLYELRVKRQEELRQLKGQLHVQYYRCVAYQKQLEALPTGVAQWEIMRDRLERAHSHYNNIRQRFADIKQTTSQQYIAEFMDIQLPNIPVSSPLSEAQ